jgi:recombinational DNA repair ATPase RecF
MKIIKLTVENFMRLVAVEISPQGNAILITGKNAQGKTSVLDAIMSVFCGKKYQPQKPIRDGQDHAEVVVETENYIIKRTFTAKGGGSVTVSNAEGMKASSPQGLLDKLVGEIAFEPMAFFKDSKDVKRQRQQRDTLMKLVGLDFTDIDADLAKVKQQRSSVKASKDTYDFEAGQIKVPDDTPNEEISMTELTEKLTVATEHNAAQAATKQQIEVGQGEIERLEESLTDNLGLIADLRLKLSKAEDVQRQGQETLLKAQAQQEEVTKTLEPIIDVAAISKEIEEAESINEKVRKKDQQTELYIKSAAKSKAFSVLGKQMKALEAKKAERLAAAKMPIEGLSVNDETILFNDKENNTGDIPLSQVNESMQLQIAVAISMALNPKLKVILMKGNDLDEANLEAVCKLAEEKDYQVWIERITGAGKTGFIIEDGSVREEGEEVKHPRKSISSEEATGDTAKVTDGELFKEEG